MNLITSLTKIKTRITSVRRVYRNTESILGILLVMPLLIWLLGTILYPLLSAIRLSFLDVGIIGTGGRFVGLENYKYALLSPEFWSSLGRSILWVLGNGVIQTVIAFIAALILRQPFRGRSFARIWIILSWIVPTVVVVIIWRWMLGTSGGIINYLLVTLNIVPSPVGFFGSPGTAFISVVLINSWRWFPLMTVILLAGMLVIPEELYEAAKVDGASSWQRFKNITIPALQPITFVLGLVGTLWSINVFDVIWLLTGGGPGSATTTLPVLIYHTAFKGYRLSRASAISVIFGLILLGFIWMYLRFLGRSQEEKE